MTGKDLEERGVSSIADLSLMTPGVSYSPDFGRSAERPVVRGISVTRQDAPQPVSIFIDGVYVRDGALSMGIEDAQRIEVMKGPQSALYGRNAFNGGFLRLDNIGVFDRSAPLPTGGVLEQADGTAWMVFFTQNMLELAIAIAEEDDDYEDFILKFVQHFYWIGGGMDRVGDQQDELWDEDDGFFYDVLLLPDGSATRIKVRSMVGLLPLAAVTVIPESTLTRFPAVAAEVGAFVRRHPENCALGESDAIRGGRTAAASRLRRLPRRPLAQARRRLGRRTRRGAEPLRPVGTQQ